MISDLVYSANGVLPIFLTALVGYILRAAGFLNENFVSVLDKLVFRVMLPCMLFTKVAYTDKSLIVPNDFGLAFFCLAAVVVLTLLLMLFVPSFISNRARAGAFIQGVFRSNLAILGVPFAQNLFGDTGARLAAVLLACVVPLYNVLAVVVLNVFNPANSKGSKNFLSRIVSVLWGIVKNPLIISIAIAVPFCFYGWRMPVYVSKTVDYFAGCATPLALIAIGASFKLSDLNGRLGTAVCACLCKTVLVPSALMAFCYFVLGYTGTHLGMILIVFGTPTAVSSYIMAKNMNSDSKLANQIVLLTTLLCVFTIFLFSFALRRLNLI